MGKAQLFLLQWCCGGSAEDFLTDMDQLQLSDQTLLLGLDFRGRSDVLQEPFKGCLNYQKIKQRYTHTQKRIMCLSRKQNNLLSKTTGNSPCTPCWHGDIQLRIFCDSLLCPHPQGSSTKPSSSSVRREEGWQQCSLQGRGNIKGVCCVFHV